MDVTINENQINIPTDIATWGDLLDWVETDWLRSGQCITHVYLGGSETLNYRDGFVRERDLEVVGDVAIHSGDFDNVVQESLAELDRELGNALLATDEIVRLFENRQEEDAYNRLAELLESIRIFFTIFSEDLGWIESPEADLSRKEFSTVLERALTELIAAQEKRYWVSVCDVLEYEITPILESWQKMVARTREHIN
jgi:hypothetical protein